MQRRSGLLTATRTNTLRSMTLTEAALAIWGHLLLRLAHHGLTIRLSPEGNGIYGIANNLPLMVEAFDRLRRT